MLLCSVSFMDRRSPCKALCWSGESKSPSRDVARSQFLLDSTLPFRLPHSLLLAFDMCGLAAIFAYHDDVPGVDAGELMRMHEQMKPRGPDGAGECCDPERRVGFGGCARHVYTQFALNETGS